MSLAESCGLRDDLFGSFGEDGDRLLAAAVAQVLAGGPTSSTEPELNDEGLDTVVNTLTVYHSDGSGSTEADTWADSDSVSLNGARASTMYMSDLSVDAAEAFASAYISYRLKTRTLQEETAYVMRSRVLNPRWAEGLKPHGYKGAMELSKLTEYMLGWSATSDSIEPWMFQKVTEAYILDDGWRQWIDENNPYALKEMIEDMIEADDRGLWDAPDEIREQLRELYLEAEGRAEGLGTTRGDNGPVV